jgi:DNA repair protein RecO (recombination protein O)
MMRRERVYPSPAIALKRMDYGEADRIVTVLTPDYGKLRLMAKGVRRSTSRMAGHLELFSHAHLMIARGRDLDLATQASTIEPFRGVREDLVKASHAYHLGELVDALLEDRDAHRPVFVLLRDALAALEAGFPRAELVARHFELQVLGEVGFRPELGACLSCRAGIQPDRNRYSVPLGGVLCPSCGPGEVTAAPIAVDLLKLLRLLQRTPRVRELGVRVPDVVVKGAERLLQLQLEHVLERRLRAAEFVRRVAEDAATWEHWEAEHGAEPAAPHLHGTGVG